MRSSEAHLAGLVEYSKLDASWLPSVIGRMQNDTQIFFLEK
jgi:hypothetical protein